jgi:AcrR family transcriptional regulator
VTSSHTEEAAGSADRTAEVRPPAGMRRRILDAACELFLEQEPRDVKLSAVAERAEITDEDLASVFPTRSALIGDLAALLYLRTYPFEYETERGGDLRWLLEAYLRIQADPEPRLVWKLGEEINRDNPGDPDAAYWHLVGDIEFRLVGAGVPEPAAHRRALVLTSALLLVANRAANDLTTPEEIEAFVESACEVGLD